MSPVASAPLRAWFRVLFAYFSAAYWRDWFSRPCGGREVLWLAAPIVVSSGSFALMNFADRVFLTWFDQNGMSAAFTSGCLLWGAASFPFGVATFVNAFVAQYFGAKEFRRIGPVVWQGVFIGLLCGPLFMGATPVVKILFRSLEASPEIVRLQSVYWFYFSCGVGASIANESLAAFFCGRRKMKTVMIVGLIAVFLNVVLDYFLIFGVAGHCRLGVAGAAIATSISLWVKFFIFLALMLKSDKKGLYGVVEGCRFRVVEFFRLFKFGAMSSAQTTAENWCFTFFVLLVGTTADGASAATAIAFNLDFLVFMPIVGVGVAVTTLVGNQIGANNPNLAARATKTSLVLASVLAGVFTLAFLVAPNVFLDFYAMKNPSEFEIIREMATNILRFVAVYLFADALNVVFASALRGAGDATFIMRATLSIFPPITLATFVGVRYFGRGLYWCWSLLTIYVFVAAAVYAIRFYLGKWKDKRLVEQKSINDAPHEKVESSNAAKLIG